MSDFYFWATLVLAAIVVFLVLTLYVKIRANMRNIEGLQQDLTGLEDRLTLFNQGAVGIGRRLIEAERRLKNVAEDQAQLMQHTSDLTYTQAGELIESGATLEELVKRCNIPRSEAELMMLIHRQLKESVTS